MWIAAGYDQLFLVRSQVGDNDEVQVGDTHEIQICELGAVTTHMESGTLEIAKLMQIQCETTEELLAWMTGLAVLQKVNEKSADKTEEKGADGEEEVVVVPKKWSEKGDAENARGEGTERLPSRDELRKHIIFLIMMLLFLRIVCFAMDVAVVMASGKMNPLSPKMPRRTRTRMTTLP